MTQIIDPTPQATEKPKKPWYKKWWIWVIAALVIAVALTPGSEKDKEPKIPPTVVGMTLDKAKKELRAEKWEVEYEDARESRMVLSDKNWIVLTEKQDGETIHLGVEKADDAAKALEAEKAAAEEAQQAEKSAAEEAMKAAEQDEKDSERAAQRALEDSGPNLGMAQVLCEREGKSEFPFGFKMHSIMGVLAEKWTEGNLFLKYEITVTNMFNAKETGVMECSVNGIGDDVTLDYFLAY